MSCKTNNERVKEIEYIMTNVECCYNCAYHRQEYESEYCDRFPYMSFPIHSTGTCKFFKGE